jgi:hypothetical protein
LRRAMPSEFSMSGEQFSLVVSSAPSFSLRATRGLFVLSVGLCADGLANRCCMRGTLLRSVTKFYRDTVMYRTRLLPALVGLGILFSLPAACLAKDYCLNLSGTQLIEIGFTVPKKNSCKPWVGFGFTFSGNSPSSGTGCTSKDGSTLSLTITTSEPESGGPTFFDSAVRFYRYPPKQAPIMRISFPMVSPAKSPRRVDLAAYQSRRW